MSLLLYGVYWKMYWTHTNLGGQPSCRRSDGRHAHRIDVGNNADFVENCIIPCWPLGETATPERCHNATPCKRMSGKRSRGERWRKRKHIRYRAMHRRQRHLSLTPASHQSRMVGEGSGHRRNESPHDVAPQHQNFVNTVLNAYSHVASWL